MPASAWEIQHSNGTKNSCRWRVIDSLALCRSQFPLLLKNAGVLQHQHRQQQLFTHGRRSPGRKLRLAPLPCSHRLETQLWWVMCFLYVACHLSEPRNTAGPTTCCWPPHPRKAHLRRCSSNILRHLCKQVFFLSRELTVSSVLHLTRHRRMQTEEVRNHYNCRNKHGRRMNTTSCTQPHEYLRN